MKKMIIAVTLILLGATAAQADQYIKINKGIKGLVLGAGGGAIAGQAIGRNTESTLIGTAVGTMIGYMVGNEMDKNSYQPGQVSYRQPYEPSYIPPRSSYRPVYEPVPEYQVRRDNCKEVEILGTVHGSPEKFITTACETPQGWILVDPPSESAAAYYRYQPQPSWQRSSVNRGYEPYYQNYPQRIVYQY